MITQAFNCSAHFSNKDLVFILIECLQNTIIFECSDFQQDLSLLIKVHFMKHEQHLSLKVSPP